MNFSLKALAGTLVGVGLGMRKAVAQSLPAPQLPNGVADGDFIGAFDALGQDAIGVVVFIVGAVAFLIVGYAVVTKFKEATSGRAEWGEVAVTGLVGGVILVFSTFLLTQANDVFAQPE